MLPSCPRNTRPVYWKELPNLKAFLKIYVYLKNNASAKHVQKVLIVLSIWSIFILT